MDKGMGWDEKSRRTESEEAAGSGEEGDFSETACEGGAVLGRVLTIQNEKVSCFMWCGRQWKVMGGL